MTPFHYPTAPHTRRHGPQGYRDVESYRQWLRDEFSFRCVFCLRREQWDGATSLHLDHFLPANQFPSRGLDYDNLLYACARCNLTKSQQQTLDPTEVLLRDLIDVESDGTLRTSDKRCAQLIAELRLNAAEMIYFRRIWIEIVAMAKHARPELFRQLMGLPDDLPNLSRLRPPGGNTRTEGVYQSFYAMQQRGVAPAIY